MPATLFIPRQIILNSGNMLNNTNTNSRDLLLQSIAAFLDTNGYRKTLKALLSEANLQSDCWKTASVNLENQFDRILELSNSHTKLTVDSQKYKDSKINLEDSTAKDARESMAPSGNGDANVLEETKEKKRKKKSPAASLAENADDKSTEACNGATEKTDLNHLQNPPENKEKKKKKHKLSGSSDPSTGAEDGGTRKSIEVPNDKTEPKSLSNIVSESEEKVEKKKKSMDAYNGATERTDLNHSQNPPENKEKKRKKHKLSGSSDPSTGAEDVDTCKSIEVPTDKIEELKSSSNIVSESEEKVEKKKKKKVKDAELEHGHVSEELHKKEKKKKSKVTSEGLSAANSDHLAEEKSDDQNKKQTVNQETENSDPLNKNIALVDCSNNETVKFSKKRKRESKVAAEASKVKSEDGNQDNDPNKAKMSSSENEHPVDTKKRRTEDSEKENPETPAGNKTANGNTDPNGGGVGDTFSKSVKNAKQSTERKSSVPFQRVKVDEVKFVDERLQDNSYWAKGGADSGYGAKAQEVLGQVKGRDFRHEKTKKKRGSYRGGQIDLNTHSIKFNYSDDE